MKEFSASYDRTTKIVSTLISVLLLGSAAAMVRITPFGWIGPLIVLATYAYSPLGYAISDEDLIIRRWVGNLRIPLEIIREVRPAAPGELSRAIRLWGSGALFGYYGLFRSSGLGNAWWYVTNRANCVVVVTAGKTFVISPDDVDGLVSSLRAWAPEVIHAGEPRTVGSTTGKAIAFVLTLIPLGIVAAAFLYSPGAPGYTLTPDHLSIHDRFYPVTLNAQSVDVTDLRVIDLKTDSAWRPVMRTGGFANTHYRAGWFRVANGQKVRLYQAGSSRVVLIPPKGDGNAVLYQTAEPEQFIAEVRREWKTSSE